MNIGFVGNGADKFTHAGGARACVFIIDVLRNNPGCTVVSGHAPVGGIDIWAEERATLYGHPALIYAPEIHQWDPPGRYGFKKRNLDIARASDKLYVILADSYPPEYRSRRFDVCYHCAKIRPDNARDHVKSGGCWTGMQALRLGADVEWVVIPNGGE